MNPYKQRHPTVMATEGVRKNAVDYRVIEVVDGRETTGEKTSNPITVHRELDAIAEKYRAMGFTIDYSDSDNRMDAIDSTNSGKKAHVVYAVIVEIPRPNPKHRGSREAESFNAVEDQTDTE